MNYFTATIPLPLAEKLKKKGMHQLRDSRMEGWLNSGDNITYAEVFDWLMKKGVLMEQTHLFGEFCMRPIMFNSDGEIMPIAHYYKCNSWHEAAEAAIEKALTLI